MDDVFINEMKQKLLDSMDKVKTDIVDLKESTKPIKPENSLGRLTRMDAIGAKSIGDAALKNARLRMTQIQSALERIEKGEYGICVLCEEEISHKRLLAVPHAPTCLSCSG